ncbi:MAG: MFS transporter [Lachnospiraceae bacterium]|nr:MFS transporter [Lachnospiraceae bacterium]
MKFTFKTTIVSCFIAYIVQAVVNNFSPLLFITFNETYQIPLSQITLLVSINFAVQLTVDLLATKYVDRIGYRPCIVAAHFFAASGLCLLAILPEYMEPFTGLMIAGCTYAIGGGLIEVLISPIMERCPTDNKEAAMSLLHSFYCWGHVGVVLISTFFFYVMGIKSWKLLAFVWALIPLLNAFIFMKTPIVPLISEGETGMSVKELFANKTFWLLLIMMICAGASEQSVSQWASAFAEQGLGVDKTIGDLAGPMMFAISMGTARAIYGKYGEKIDLDRFMKGSTILCIGSYLMISMAPFPVLSLVGCSICGFSVGCMWPGTFSKASVALKTGGTAMFALLALGGDLGCSAGAAVVGVATEWFGGNMKYGILTAVLFPVLLAVCLFGTKSKQSHVQI